MTAHDLGARHQYVGAFAGSAAFRVAPNDAVAYSLSDPHGIFQLVAQTRHEPYGEGQSIPRELWIQVSGPGVSLDAFITHAQDMANTITSILTFAHNSGTDFGVQANLAFDACEAHEDHPYFQNVIKPESGPPRPARNVDVTAMQSLLRDLFAHSDKDRLLRAIGQYEAALRHWRPGGEVMALAHLYVTMEVLTPLIRRKEEQKVGGEAQLAKQWKLVPKQCSKCGHQFGLGGIIDVEVRKRVLFRGETAVYKQAKEASDGLEHGYLPVATVRAHAGKHMQRLSVLARHAIVDLISADADWRGQFLTSARDNPLGSFEIAQYVRATLRGPADKLPAAGNVYPYFDVAHEITDISLTHDGTWQMSIDGTTTYYVGEGVLVEDIRMEHWAAISTQAESRPSTSEADEPGL